MYEMQEKHFHDLLKEGQEREEAKRKVGKFLYNFRSR